MTRTVANVESTSTAGPFLAAALFCESLIDGTDGALSVIRIADNLTVTIPPDAPENVPSEVKPVPASIWLLVTLRKGDGPREHELSIVLHAPSGQLHRYDAQKIVLSPEPYGGANVKVRVNLLLKAGGLHWFDIEVDGKLMTRVPLNIAITRAEASPLIEKSPAAKAARKKSARNARRKTKRRRTSP